MLCEEHNQGNMFRCMAHDKTQWKNSVANSNTVIDLTMHTLCNDDSKRKAPSILLKTLDIWQAELLQHINKNTVNKNTESNFAQSIYVIAVFPHTLSGENHAKMRISDFS